MSVKKTSKQFIEQMCAVSWGGNVTEWQEYGGIQTGEVLENGMTVHHIFADGKSGCVWMVASLGNNWYEIDLAYAIRYDTIPF